MKIHLSICLVSIVVAGGLASTHSFAATVLPNDQGAVEQIQYDRFQDRRPDRDDRYQDRRPDRNDRDRDFRGPVKWRPGQVLPGQLLERVVGDWEDRGLSRPPNGHAWVRVGQQFVLVRFSDRMIARILNFD